MASAVVMVRTALAVAVALMAAVTIQMQEIPMVVVVLALVDVALPLALASALAAAAVAAAVACQPSIHELSGMRMSALKQRALAAGVGRSAVDEVDDSEEPKEAIIGLLLDVDILANSLKK